VALFHGGGQTRHSWAATTAVLAANGWRAATVELRGHGDSDWAPDGDYSMDAFAADARAAAAALGGPPILVGASLGGLSCMVAVTEAPDPSAVARGLVLVDVAHEMEEVGKARIATFMAAAPDGFASLEEAADAIAAYNPNRPRPKDLSGLAKNLRQREDGRWAWHWDPEFIHGQQGSTDETRSAVIDPTRLTASVDALASIGQPTLLVRGRTSDLLSEEGAQDFLRRVPHAEYADVAGAGHMVAGDRNEVFNKAILEFLERHRD
jgi:pimeloyl-ACP methyl ester carboxylesterase